MSETRSPDTPDSTDRNPTFPRAVVHKRILEIAESRPEASMEAIAADVTGATTALVEQVFEEYGDPGHNEESTDDATSTATADELATDAADESPADETAMSDQPDDIDAVPIDPAAVTEKQLETLRAIRDHPHATQAALAEQLGVTSATISQRVNGIDGFDWAERETFVDRFFDQDEAMGEEAALATADTGDADDGPPEVTDGDSAETAAAAADVTGAAAPADDAADTPIDADHAGEPAEEGADVLEPATASADTALGDGGDIASEAATDTEHEPEDAQPEPTADTPAARSDKLSESVGREGASRATRHTTAATATESGPPDQSVAHLADQVTNLTARLETLERRLANDHSVDPELAHKVIHACFNSDQISAAEEVQVIEGILAADSSWPNATDNGSES